MHSTQHFEIFKINYYTAVYTCVYIVQSIRVILTTTRSAA